MGDKICTACKESHPYSAFTKGNDSMGLAYVCRVCAAIYKSAVATQRKEHPEIYATKKEYLKEKTYLLSQGKKHCKTCDTIQILDAFPARKESKDGRRNLCFSCTRDKHAVWMEKRLAMNPNLSSEQYFKHREKHLIKSKEYRKAHKEERNIKRRERYNDDKNYRMKRNMSARVNKLLRGTKRPRDLTTMKLLGCTMEEFSNHIEMQFTSTMSWDAIFSGAIHMDHIRPCASYDLTDMEQVKKCFHYTNYQPLWKVDNLKKHAMYKGKNYRRK